MDWPHRSAEREAEREMYESLLEDEKKRLREVRELLMKQQVNCYVPVGPSTPLLMST